MVNIYDTANQLAEDLKQTPEYDAVTAAIAAVKLDTEALTLYQKMDELQKKLMTKQSAGQQPSQEDQMQYQTLSQQLKNNPKMADLMTKEETLYKLLNDVQEVFTKPLSEAYESLSNLGK